MTYPIPDPATPNGELFLDAAEWAANLGGCWAHNRRAPECEACRGELTREELAEGVAFARRAFARWLAADRPLEVMHVIPAAFGASERYGLALTIVAVGETVEAANKWPM